MYSKEINVSVGCRYWAEITPSAYARGRHDVEVMQSHSHVSPDRTGQLPVWILVPPTSL